MKTRSLMCTAAPRLAKSRAIGVMLQGKNRHAFGDTVTDQQAHATVEEDFAVDHRMAATHALWTVEATASMYAAVWADSHAQQMAIARLVGHAMDGANGLSYSILCIVPSPVSCIQRSLSCR